MSRVSFYVLAVFLSFLFIPLVFAGLGDQVSTKINLKEKFNVREIRFPEYKMREYINSEKKVFAVAWSGISHPELKQVLSAHYDEYVQAAKKQKRIHGKRFRVVKSKNVTLILSGHMRNLKGKAYLHSGLPLGVKNYEIR